MPLSAARPTSHSTARVGLQRHMGPKVSILQQLLIPNQYQRGKPDESKPNAEISEISDLFRLSEYVGCICVEVILMRRIIRCLLVTVYSP
eukprot:2140460-Amphidinium_carterae.1